MYLDATRAFFGWSAMLLCCMPFSVHAEPGVAVLWDESVDGALPYNLNALSDKERERFTFDLSAPLSKVVGQSDGGERFLVVVPSGMELVEVRIRVDNTISNNAHILLIEPYPHGSTFPNCMQSQTYTSINEMVTVGLHAFSEKFITAGPRATYLVSSTMAVSGLSIPAQFEIEFSISDAPIFYSGFSCRQFPDFSGA